MEHARQARVTTPAWRLAAAVNEPDQTSRLQFYHEHHPEVDISQGEAGTLRALIPPRDGNRLTGRELFGYTLRELLNHLDQIFPPAEDDDG